MMRSYLVHVSSGGYNREMDLLDIPFRNRMDKNHSYIM